MYRRKNIFLFKHVIETLVNFKQSLLSYIVTMSHLNYKIFRLWFKFYDPPTRLIKQMTEYAGLHYKEIAGLNNKEKSFIVMKDHD